MDCFGTYFTHVQTCDDVRVHSATEWVVWGHGPNGPNGPSGPTWSQLGPNGPSGPTWG